MAQSVSDIFAQLDSLLGVHFFSGEGTGDAEHSPVLKSGSTTNRILVVNVHRARGRDSERGPPTTVAIVVNGDAHIAPGQASGHMLIDALACRSGPQMPHSCRFGVETRRGGLSSLLTSVPMTQRFARESWKCAWLTRPQGNRSRTQIFPLRRFNACRRRSSRRTGGPWPRSRRPLRFPSTRHGRSGGR